MNILIANSYSFYNAGDAAIVLGMLEVVRTVFPEAHITIVSDDPENDKDKYGATVIPSFLPVGVEGNLNRLRYLAQNVIENEVLARIGLRLNERSLLNAYRNADMVLFCGGGYLGQTGLRAYLSAASKHLAIHFASLLGKPSIMFPQSVEPYGPPIWLQKKAMEALHKVDVFFAREQRTAKYLVEEVGLNREQVRLAPDAAFSMPCISSERGKEILRSNGIVLDSRSVGVTLRQWSFPNHIDAKGQQQNYFRNMVKVLRQVHDSLDAIIVLVPQVSVGAKDDDSDIARAMKQVLSESGCKRVHLLTGRFSPQELQAVYGCLDLMVGTRMHSNILSLAAGTPSVAIAYQKKTWGIMEFLGLSEYVVDIVDLSSDHLYGLIQKALDNNEYSKDKCLDLTQRLRDQLLADFRDALTVLNLHSNM